MGFAEASMFEALFIVVGLMEKEIATFVILAGAGLAGCSFIEPAIYNGEDKEEDKEDDREEGKEEHTEENKEEGHEEDDHPCVHPPSHTCLEDASKTTTSPMAEDGSHIWA